MKKQITTTEARQLEKLIDSVKNKFEIKDIVFFFLESMQTWGEKSEFIDALIDNNEMKTEIKEELESEMISEGFIVLKVENLVKRWKIADFINSEIFPFYNEQPTFFN